MDNRFSPEDTVILDRTTGRSVDIDPPVSAAQKRGGDTFVTRVLPYPSGTSSQSDSDMEANGWMRVWASVTTEGVFAVYTKRRTW